MTRERALELHGQLREGIGEGARISGQDYRWLMENRDYITPEEKADYVTQMVRFLRTSLAAVPKIPDSKKCLSNADGSPDARHANLFEIGWSRFGNITIEKWSGDEWVLQ